MSAPADRLQQLSLDDGMPPRGRLVESPNNHRLYDLGALSSAQLEAADDGLRPSNLRLLPIIGRAVFREEGEEGYLGFNVDERHVVRIPATNDNGEDHAVKASKCTCPTFGRHQVCPHLTWLYDGVQQAFKSPRGIQTPEQLTGDQLQQYFSQLASRISDVSGGPPLTEAINRQQNPQQSPAEIDQNVLDTLAIFERGIVPEDESSRKKPKREGDSPEGSKSNVPELKTCLDLDSKEFFSRTRNPDLPRTLDLVIPGDLQETLKGLLRHSRVLRESLNHIVDDRYKAKDFVNRLKWNFDEWYWTWKQYRNDNRRTVAPQHIQQFAAKVRSIIANLRQYDNGIREVPDSYYDDAIELAISVLGKLCGADLEYTLSTFGRAETTARGAAYTSAEPTNIDIFKDHTRQPENKQPKAEEIHNRNLFFNLIVSPPQGSLPLTEEVARLIDQWSDDLTELEDHIDNIKLIGKTMQAEFESDSSITQQTAAERLAPLRRLVQTHGS